MTLLLDPFADWYCPNCGLTDRTPASAPNRYHPCPKMAGLAAPLLRAGMKAKIEAHEREDDIGTDLVRRDDNGRPIMSITTEREDGMDTIVFAPTAVSSAEARR